MKVSFKDWMKSGSPFIWLNAGAVAISIIMVIGLIGFIAAKGLVHFWPGAIVQAEYTVPGNSSNQIMGQISDEEMVSNVQLQAIGLSAPEGEDEAKRLLLKVGNRDVYGGDFRWVLEHHLTGQNYPEKAMAIERRKWGNFLWLPRKCLRRIKTSCQHSPRRCQSLDTFSGSDYSCFRYP